MDEKILIAAPIAAHKHFSIDYWVWWIFEKNTYKNFTALLLINGKNDGSLAADLQSGHDKLQVIDTEYDHPELLARVSYARNEALRYAIKWNYDKILFLDTDTIPLITDLIPTLMSHNKPFVSGLYFYKRTPMQAVVNIWVDKEKEVSRLLQFTEVQKWAASKDNHGKLMKIASCGMGCVLIDRSLFDLPFRYVKTDDQVQGEDVAFCDDLIKLRNITPMLDPRCVCKHLAEGEGFNR